MSELNPFSVAVDQAGDVFVGDDNSRVEKITPAGQLSIVAGNVHMGSPTPGPALKSALGRGGSAGGLSVAVAPAGSLFIADSENDVVERSQHRRKSPRTAPRPSGFRRARGVITRAGR